MNRKLFIVALAGVLLFTFAATPAVHANPLVVVIPVAAILSVVFGTAAHEVNKNESNTKKAEAYQANDSAGTQIITVSHD